MSGEVEGVYFHKVPSFWERWVDATVPPVATEVKSKAGKVDIMVVIPLMSTSDLVDLMWALFSTLI